jgi:hypothetical protein
LGISVQSPFCILSVNVAVKPLFQTLDATVDYPIPPLRESDHAADYRDGLYRHWNYSVQYVKIGFRIDKN